MLRQPITPVIVRVIEQPTPETTVADVLLEAVGLTGVFVLVAILAGLIVGGVLIGLKMFRPDNSFNGRASNHTTLGLDPGSF